MSPDPSTRGGEYQQLATTEVFKHGAAFWPSRRRRMTEPIPKTVCMVGALTTIDVSLI